MRATAWAATPSSRPIVNYGVALEKQQESGGLSFGRPGRNWVACINYGKTISAKRKPKKAKRKPKNEARTGLAFELALRFKIWTGPTPQDALDIRNRGWLPGRQGRPQYELVALFINAAIHEQSLDNLQTRNDETQKVKGDLDWFKHEYPDAKFMGWPVPVTP